MKENVEQLLARSRTTPFLKEDLLSLAGTENVQDDWIVLVKQKRGK